MLFESLKIILINSLVVRKIHNAFDNINVSWILPTQYPRKN
jgi:hypothetical protein